MLFRITAAKAEWPIAADVVVGAAALIGAILLAEKTKRGKQSA